VSGAAAAIREKRSQCGIAVQFEMRACMTRVGSGVALPDGRGSARAGGWDAGVGGWVRGLGLLIGLLCWAGPVLGQSTDFKGNIINPGKPKIALPDFRGSGDAQS